MRIEVLRSLKSVQTNKIMLPFCISLRFLWIFKWNKVSRVPLCSCVLRLDDVLDLNRVSALRVLTFKLPSCYLSSAECAPLHLVWFDNTRTFIFVWHLFPSLGSVIFSRLSCLAGLAVDPEGRCCQRISWTPVTGRLPLVRSGAWRFLRDLAGNKLSGRSSHQRSGSRPNSERTWRDSIWINTSEWY